LELDREKIRRPPEQQSARAAPDQSAAAAMWSSFKKLFRRRGESVEEAIDASVHGHAVLEKRAGLASGGAARPDGAVAAGWAVTRGRRSYNEDTVVCEFRPHPSDPAAPAVACLGVFDGHGGAAASAFVRDRLYASLLGHPEFDADTFAALVATYADTDAAYLVEDERRRNDDGTTATTALVVGDRLVVAHVGDSRAVLGEAGGALALTADHKPNRPDERARIAGGGGTVVHAGTWRVGEFSCVLGRPVEAENVLETNHSLITDHYPK
jgi:hypothetical protein